MLYHDPARPSLLELPVCEDSDGLLLLNPGSPTERRRAPFRSFAELDLADDGMVVAQIVAL